MARLGMARGVLGAGLGGALDGGAARSWRYPEWYRWFIVLASLDVVLTSVILSLGGTEINALACWLFREAGPIGLLLLKLASVVLVLLICECVGRQRPSWGRGVAMFAACANAVPVAAGLMCLGMFGLVLR